MVPLDARERIADACYRRELSIEALAFELDEDASQTLGRFGVPGPGDVRLVDVVGNEAG
jgi:hypothetical protein